MEKQSTYKNLEYRDLGIVDYRKAWELQKEIFELRRSDKVPDTLLLLEHPNTYTLGKSTDKSNLLFSEQELKEKKISVYEIDRGGDITYHGPGQIVGYPIINLSNWEQDTHKYLRALEEVIIDSLAEFGIVTGRNPKHTGVWVGDNKICAIGIKVSRWITMHGFALNVNTDMEMFNGIIPCGINDKGVTSIEKIKNEKINIDIVKKSIVQNFIKIFNYNIYGGKPRISDTRYQI